MTDGRLVLWDIDRTLVDGRGLGKRICAAAFTAVTGYEPTREFTPDGSTDPAILRDLLDMHGIDDALPDPARVEEIFTAAMAACALRWRREARPMSGAATALDALAGNPNVLQTVLTGNVRANAHAKLAMLGLDRHVDFDVGGYGSDSAVRWDLVAIAQGRAARKYGTKYDARTTVLIGDTPKDVRAGVEGGAKVVAVAAGAYGAAELRAAGADVVLHDLRDTAALLHYVLA